MARPRPWPPLSAQQQAVLNLILPAGDKLVYPTSDARLCIFDARASARTGTDTFRQWVSANVNAANVYGGLRLLVMPRTKIGRLFQLGKRVSGFELGI